MTNSFFFPFWSDSSSFFVILISSPLSFFFFTILLTCWLKKKNHREKVLFQPPESIFHYSSYKISVFFPLSRRFLRKETLLDVNPYEIYDLAQTLYRISESILWILFWVVFKQGYFSLHKISEIACSRGSNQLKNARERAFNFRKAKSSRFGKDKFPFY